MIDIHNPHESIHSWRDILIHLAIVVAGILIAIGLEQTVEYIHHQQQVRETREALRIERQLNIRRFALETEEFRRSSGMLIMDSNVLRYLRTHPHVPTSQWSGHLSFTGILVTYSDSAWNTAQQSGVLAYMPRAEVRQLDELYDRLDELNSLSDGMRDSVYQARALYLDSPDPAQLTPAQLDSAIEHLNQTRICAAIRAQEQRNVAIRYADFTPAPTAAEISALMQSPPNSSGTSTDLWQQLMNRWNAIESDAHALTH